MRTPAPKHNRTELMTFLRLECLPRSDQPMKRLKKVNSFEVFGNLESANLYLSLKIIKIRRKVP